MIIGHMSIMDGLDTEFTVTSSDLVRNFGTWQERVQRSPLYIMHRGRPRAVMLSVDSMTALCARVEGPVAGANEQVGAIVEAYDEAVILADPTGTVTGFNHVAKARFPSVNEGSLVVSLGGDFLKAAVVRVAESGTSEVLEVTLYDRPSREYVARLCAMPEGVVILLRDVTAAERLRENDARMLALIEAVEAGGNAATFRLDQRGSLVEPRQSLARLVQAAHDQLAGVRLVTLVSTADRPKVAEMISQVLATGKSASDQIVVLVQGRKLQTAKLSLGSVNPIGRVTELQGTLTFN